MESTLSVWQWTKIECNFSLGLEVFCSFHFRIWVESENLTKLNWVLNKFKLKGIFYEKSKRKLCDQLLRLWYFNYLFLALYSDKGPGELVVARWTWSQFPCFGLCLIFGRGSSSFPPTRMWIKLGKFVFLIFIFSSADLGQSAVCTAPRHPHPPPN